MPELRAATQRDWQVFRRLAVNEKWRVPQLEQRLLQSEFADAVQLLGEGEAFYGIVSAVHHARSGWIGNLLVPPKLRRQGYGKKLFETALESLTGEGAATVWLTASDEGRLLYERYDFKPVGKIERWVLAPGGKSVHKVQPCSKSREKLRQADLKVWGESRERLLDGLSPGALALSEQDAVALLQTDQRMQILGPWYAPNACPRSNRLLLQAVLESRDSRLELVVDALADSPVKMLLQACGFSFSGETTLMVRGARDAIDLQSMVSLASLGSIG